MQALIDVHSHLGQYSVAAMSADGERLCALYRQAGVTHAVTFSIEACYGGIDAGNRYTVEQVSKHDMLSAMVVAHPSHLDASRAWIAQAKTNSNIIGVKLHPALGNWDLLSRASMRLMEEAIAPSGLPVLSHIGNDSPNSTIDKYLELAGRFPSVRFIAAHLGIGILGLADVAIDAWSKTPRENVWFDMGTLRAFLTGSVEALLRAAGPERILFGTDAPLYHPAPFVRMLSALEIDEATRERIAWRNVLQVIPALRGRVGVPE